MKLLDRFFNSESDDHFSQSIKLGRFSDAYKSEKQLNHLNHARELWSKHNYIASLTALLSHLHDDDQGNIHFALKDDQLEFSLYQGSRTIYGRFSENHGFNAYARIAKINDFSIGYLRALVERTGKLKSSRYTLSADNEIRLTLSLPSYGVHPDRVYNALKELALHADKLDDLLIEEFNSLSPIIEKHRSELPEKEIQAKLNYYYTRVEKALSMFDRINDSPQEKVNIQLYIGLSTVYSIEYLVSPEGLTRERLENIHHEYYKKDHVSFPRKVKNLTQSIKELSLRNKEALLPELYDVSTTFGLTHQTNTSTFRNFIDEHWPALIKYAQYSDKNYAQCVCDFIVGHALFNFGLPLFLRELLGLYYRVREESFFIEAGMKQSLVLENNQISTHAIDIANKILSSQKQLHSHTKTLALDDSMVWSISFIAMLRQMF